MRNVNSGAKPGRDSQMLIPSLGAPRRVESHRLTRFRDEIGWSGYFRLIAYFTITYVAESGRFNQK